MWLCPTCSKTAMQWPLLQAERCSNKTKDDVSKPLLESMCKDDGVNTTVFFDVQAQLECLRRAATDDFQELCNKIWLQMHLAGF